MYISSSVEKYIYFKRITAEKEKKKKKRVLCHGGICLFVCLHLLLVWSFFLFFFKDF